MVITLSIIYVIGAFLVSIYFLMEDVDEEDTGKKPLLIILTWPFFVLFCVYVITKNWNKK